MLVLLAACAAPEAVHLDWYTETLPPCDRDGYTYWTPPEDGDVMSFTLQRFTKENDIYQDSQSVTVIDGAARIYCGSGDTTRVTYGVRRDE